MALFPHHGKSNKPNSHAEWQAIERPRLYILAFKPAIPSQSHVSEWCLELRIPSAPATFSRPKALSRNESGFLNILHHKHKHNAEVAPARSESIKEEATLPAKHYYFSRLHPEEYTEEPPKEVALSIFLTAFPSSINAKHDPPQLIKTICDALALVHLTSDSVLWVRQALFALQIGEIIPAVSDGLDINKFMSFATSYLDEHVDSNGPETKQVNYLRILRENERLRCMLSSDVTDYQVVHAAADKEDDSTDDQDIWNSPARTKPTKTKQKTWGGFWITHGSGASSGTGSRVGSRRTSPHRDGEVGHHMYEPRRTNDAYGGLM